MDKEGPEVNRVHKQGKGDGLGEVNTGLRDPEPCDRRKGSAGKESRKGAIRARGRSRERDAIPRKYTFKLQSGLGSLVNPRLPIRRYY